MSDSDSASEIDIDLWIENSGKNDILIQFEELKNRISSLEDRHMDDGETEIDEGFYPQDTYSLLCLYGPTNNFRCFLLGIFVFLMQTAFLLLVFLSVMVPKVSTNEINDGLHTFLPEDVELLVKVSQVLCIMAYLFFENGTISDFLLAIQLFPKFGNKDPIKKKICRRLFLSSLLRLTQSALAIAVTCLLIFSSVTVPEVLLNFLAVDLISNFDDSAFVQAISGTYGKMLKNKAKETSKTLLPESLIASKELRKTRKKIAHALISITMLGFALFIVGRQSMGKYNTPRLRIRFNEEKLIEEEYDGCYDKQLGKTIDFRRVYTSHSPENSAGFAFCKKELRWVLFKDFEPSTNPCNIYEDESKSLIAYSSKTTVFDIKATYGDTWYTTGGTPLLNIQFLENEWSDEQCGQNFGDGKCDNVLNKLQYEYDGGDCCGATCEGAICGLGSIEKAFNVPLGLNESVEEGDGFQNCGDSEMVKISIFIEGFEPVLSSTVLSLNCNSKMHLKLRIQEKMVGNYETVYVRDGANCKLTLTAIDSITLSDIVQYSIHDDDDNNMILIHSGNNTADAEVEFQHIPKCYKEYLSSYFNESSIYTHISSSEHKSMKWLSEGYEELSECSSYLVERFLLAYMRFAMDIDSWENNKPHCNWIGVECQGGSVTNIDFAILDMSSASLPTQIGLITNLQSLLAANMNADANNYILSGTIPSELGVLTQLTQIGLYDNSLHGNIPTELGTLTSLNYMVLGKSMFTGSFPIELASLTDLAVLSLAENNLTGSIPTRLATLASLRYFGINQNFLTGSIPTEIAGLTSLEYMSIFDNDLSGPIPTELGRLTSLKSLWLSKNNLTGSIPTELAKLASLEKLYISKNNLTGFIPTELARLTSLKILHLCNNMLTGSFPTQLESLNYSTELHLSGNNLTGYFPSELGCRSVW